MGRHHSYLNSAREILSQYKEQEPFASFLKKFFSLDKKYGSKDRKQISHLCYNYFRLGKMKMELPPEERILMGLFLCSEEANEILQGLKPKWNDTINLPLNEKLSIIDAKNSYENIFPIEDELSEAIEKEKFIISHLKQPAVFLRLRPGKEKVVKLKLQYSEIEFSSMSDSCLALPNASKIDSTIELDKEAVVQDYSSQRVGEFLSLVKPGRSARVWDCCAASGGKSILLYDLYRDIELTVSDVRESILANLKKRFARAGIRKYKSFVADLTSDLPVRQAGFRPPTSDFHLIIADVPCTGSGTWGRAPENLYYFDGEKINSYSALQKKIVSNVIAYLKPGGYLLYITCSVFKKENENIIKFITQNLPAGQAGFSLQVIKMEILKGYDRKADTMFAALLQKSL